jgi:hypothetical protein
VSKVRSLTELCGLRVSVEPYVALAKQMPGHGRKSAATGHSAAPKTQLAGPCAEQTHLGEESNHVAQGGHVAKATITRPPNLSPQPVTEAPRPTVAATRKTVRPKKLEPKASAAPKPATGEDQEESIRECQNCGLQTHNTQPGSRNPKFYLPTQGNF